MMKKTETYVLPINSITSSNTIYGMTLIMWSFKS